ncbi:excalibur calcium-binding domain-containing protein [Sphingomonas sanguinis]|uniref:Excalibur calcium-binding domain-containing protein n=2 Tax=Sphingomonas sanguinis TaxID=33051 RepID=A0A7Y7QUL7_9SPHN|nr:excalibur calcium-binding domain-containing protein [Sphingomonas sanguinis]NNG53006.1 excalibur calcium-binding domain-containing protein [Sphingomonas sanguinis]NVP30709.1 excalibur calcium-binding domain-containing protein [Sphingomonas sanguinis]
MRTSTILTIAGAVVVGTIVGIGIAPGGSSTSPSIQTPGTIVSDAAAMTGIKRRREPEIGDHWGGCNDARAAGTVPIHRGEPGYDAKMDGDDDGIACEPSPGA